MQLESLEAKWVQRARFRSLERMMTLTDEGLVLGAGTILAKTKCDPFGVPALEIEGNEDRILSLLAVAYDQAVPASVIGNIGRASKYWGRGEKALALIHLAHSGLMKLDDAESDSYRLFMANKVLDAGFSPHKLLKELGIDTSPLGEWRKDNPNHDPRNGQFASGPGGAASDEKKAEANHRRERLAYGKVKNIIAENNRSGQSDELIASIAYKESRFDPNASSRSSSAKGLMQITDRSVKELQRVYPGEYDNLDRFDPSQNIAAGSALLGLFVHRAGGNVSLGLDRYGTGPGYSTNILSAARALRNKSSDPMAILKENIGR